MPWETVAAHFEEWLRALEAYGLEERAAEVREEYELNRKAYEGLLDPEEEGFSFMR